MSDNTYNGWTNRATWLVNVWFNPESRADVEMARECIDELFEQVPEGILRDMIDLSEINWDELLEHFEESEEKEECDE